MAGLRDQLRPLAGSIALHAAIFGALAIAALFQFVPETPVVKTIEAYVVRGPVPSASPPAREAPPKPAPEAPAPQPEPVQTPPQPDPAAAQAKAEAVKREREAEQARVTKEKAAAAEREVATRREAEQRAAGAKRRAADEQRKAEADAAAKRKLEQQAEERRKFEAQAKARAEAEARKKAEAELAERAAREADLDRRLAEEARRASAQSSGQMDRYAAEIAARIERAWNRPPTAKPGLRCTVQVTQVPGGVVTGAQVGECNGDEAVRQSIVSAVLRASPLPAPPEPSLFERKLTLVFAPDE
jgi:colicin import membrane protein